MEYDNLNSIKIELDLDITELNTIREKIESMPKINQVEILRLLSKDQSITLNENKYGIFINLSEIPFDMIEILQNYINYVNTQENNLNKLEKQKENFKNIYFKKDNKDNVMIKSKHV
jgi:cell division protein FtsX